MDESGSLPDDTPIFTLAGVLTYRPDRLRNVIRRAVVRSGKRLGRARHAFSEFKWSSASRRLRLEVLNRLAQTDAVVFTLTVNKGERRIEDSPENYAILICELLQACWTEHPNVFLACDRRFVSTSQIAVFNTFVYRHWPAPGVLSISHVDSQREHLVQLADFVAGSTYAFHKEGDNTVMRLGERVTVALAGDWPDIKRRWVAR